MIALLDTHVLRWWLDDPKRVSPPARFAIGNKSNGMMISAAVPWELAIKTNIGKLKAESFLARWSEIMQVQVSVSLPSTPLMRCGPAFCPSITKTHLTVCSSPRRRPRAGLSSAQILCSIITVCAASGKPALFTDHRLLGFGDGLFGWSSFSNGLLADNHLHRHGHVLVQLDGDVELADVLQRFIELDLAPVNVQALLLQLARDIDGGDRAKELIVLARLAGKVEGHAGHLLGQRLGIALLAGSAANRSGLHLLDDGPVGGRGFNRQLLGKEIVAAVALGHSHHVTA